MSSGETGQMSAVETGEMTAAETSVLSQQKTSVLSQCCPPAAPGCPRLTQTMKSKTLINFWLENWRYFVPFHFPFNFTRCFWRWHQLWLHFYKEFWLSWLRGRSQYSHPPLHQTIRTPWLKLFGERVPNCCCSSECYSMKCHWRCLLGCLSSNVAMRAVHRCAFMELCLLSRKLTPSLTQFRPKWVEVYWQLFSQKSLFSQFYYWDDLICS